MNVNFKHLCLICFLLPLFTVICSYIWSANLNLVNWCIPNIDGCTSISRVGRYSPVKFLFKPLMFIYALFLIIFWKKYFNIIKNENIQISKFYLITALCSVLFLILYIIFLGEGKYYRFFRQVGIFIFIFFTIISQILYSFKIKKLSYFKSNLKNKLIFYSTSVGVIGFFLFPFVVFELVEIKNFKNIVSWNYFLLTQIYFLIIYLGLKKNYASIQPPPSNL
tara:strand:+ start:56 stop:721 length:666 start_codon:yes stop_codon:yes gene_type:complete